MSWWKKLVNKVRGVYGGPTPEPPAAQNGCDHGDAIHLRQGTAEFEWFVARGELETGSNLRHGATHLANLLSYDPGNPEWVELLEKYLVAWGKDPDGLIPRGDKLYYTTEAMRAYLWNKQGRLEDAVDLLVQVTNAKSEIRHLEAWALNWLEPPGAIEFLPEQLGLRLFATVLNRFAEARHATLPRLREVRRWAKLYQRYARKHACDSMATMLGAGLLRKAGYFDEAETLARDAMKRSPDWHTATALGLVLRQKGNLKGAERAFEEALKHDPSDVSARLEAGDTFFERQQYAPALKWYKNALGKEREQPWAQPSALFCQWKLSNEERYLTELIELAKQENGRARHLCRLAYSYGVPEPVDATANILRQFVDTIVHDPENAPTGDASISLSCLEAPSNYLAFRIQMEALKHALSITVTAEEIPKPDPREPITEVKYLLWKYEGTDAKPGLPPPSRDVLQRIAELAAAPFDEEENWAAASRVAEELGPGGVGEVLATMVHPPAVPEGWTALQWLPRVQRAATQVAAHVDQGWDGSARKDALLSVLLGPLDWTTDAAVRVLGRIGREEEVYAPDIHEVFQRLASHRPNMGHWGWEMTLFQQWLGLPHLFPDEREALEETLRKLEARGEA